MYQMSIAHWKRILKLQTIIILTTHHSANSGMNSHTALLSTIYQGQDTQLKGISL